MNLSPEMFVGKKLMVGTPMYGGQCFGTYVKSLLELQALCTKVGLSLVHTSLYNESLIQRGRNYIAERFMQSDCTHLMFIDSDIGFNAIDVLGMIALDVDIIGAPYPKKTIRWDNVKKAIITNPEISVDDVQEVVGDYVFNKLDDTVPIILSEPTKVSHIGTGMMMIRRNVFEQFKKEYPEYEYIDDGEDNVTDRVIHSYFNVEIVKPSNRLLSEDYMFCSMCREIGIDIWLLPFVRTSHTGTYSFTGNLSAISKYS